MSVTSFANSFWELSELPENNHRRDYPSIDTQITLYWNDGYQSYTEWLTNTAPDHVTMNSPLT